MLTDSVGIGTLVSALLAVEGLRLLELLAADSAHVYATASPKLRWGPGRPGLPRIKIENKMFLGPGTSGSDRWSVLHLPPTPLLVLEDLWHSSTPEEL